MVAVPLVVVLLGAWSYRWVQEDAFINFRIIGNLLAGHGPVFNVERGSKCTPTRCGCSCWR